MKKYRLSISDSTEFHGLALVSPAKDYQLCYHINKALSVDLDKSASVYHYNPKSKESAVFSGFVFEDEEGRISYYVVKNREETRYLLPQMKQVDYVLLVQGPNAEKHLDECRKKLGFLQQIQSIFVLDSEQLTYINLE